MQPMWQQCQAGQAGMTSWEHGREEGMVEEPGIFEAVFFCFGD